MRVLGIDVGATSGRVMVASLNKPVLNYEEIHRFNTALIKDDKEIRWDIELILKEIIFGINKAFSLYRDIQSIGIDTWGVDYCYIKPDGTLVDNPYSYRDARTHKAQKKVHEIIRKNDLYKLTGIQDIHFNTLYQLYDDFHRPIKRGKDSYRLLMIPDYIAYVLTGQVRLEITNASTMGLLDYRTHHLNEQILSMLNISQSIFPLIIKPGEKYGFLKKDYLSNGYDSIPVIAVCSHDTASAVLATPIESDSIYISSGTWSLIGTLCDKALINETSYKHNFTNEIGYQEKITFLKNTMGMFIINEIRNEWKKKNEEVPLSSISKLIQDAPMIAKYIDVDDCYFEQPDHMLSKISYYLNQHNQSAPIFKGQWLRMIYLSMACKYKEIIDDLILLSGKGIKNIVISGGGSKASILNQYVSSITNLNVITGPIEATFIGNALVQYVALGLIEVNDINNIIKSSFESNFYTPSEKEFYEDIYKEYQYHVKGAQRSE